MALTRLICNLDIVRSSGLLRSEERFVGETRDCDEEAVAFNAAQMFVSEMSLVCMKEVFTTISGFEDMALFEGGRNAQNCGRRIT